MIRKAVIPAAGFGTRFLPFTKVIPKEMIPLVDKPVIQYVVEEAVLSGIDEILIIISEGKESITEHFRIRAELEKRLEDRGKTKLLREMQSINRLANIKVVYQNPLNGLGDAVRYAESFVGGEPFALLLGDTVMSTFSDRPIIGQLMDVYDRCKSSVVGLERVDVNMVSHYGIADGDEVEPSLWKLRGMVEKPPVDLAPSNLAFAARYVFQPEIFNSLRKIPTGRDNEVQLTDAMIDLMKRKAFYGYEICGRRHDIGNKLDFLKSTVEFGLRREEFADKFLNYLKEVVKEK